MNGTLGMAYTRIDTRQTWICTSVKNDTYEIKGSSMAAELCNLHMLANYLVR